MIAIKHFYLSSWAHLKKINEYEGKLVVNDILK